MCLALQWTFLAVAMNSFGSIKGVKNFMELEIGVSDVLDQVPKTVLQVQFGTISVHLGNTLSSIQVESMPKVSWKGNTTKYYTLCMTGPDVASRADPKFGDWIHWLVVNIPGVDLTKGDTLTEYVGTSPSNGETGWYVLVVYEQPKKLKFNETRLSNLDEADRSKFSIHKFTEQYNLGEPIAGNFFMSTSGAEQKDKLQTPKTNNYTITEDEKVCTDVQC